MKKPSKESRVDFLTKFDLDDLNDESKKSILKEIEKIKKIYGFKDDEDLYQKIISIPRNANCYRLSRETTLRESEKKTKIQQLTKQLTKLHSILIETPMSLQLELGYLLKKDAPSFNFFEDMDIFINVCNSMLLEIPKDVGGRKSGSMQKHFILQLAMFYAIGTGKFPEHTYNRNYNEYNGNFYQFLLDLKPVLKKLKIDLGKDSSIRTYADEVLREQKSNIEIYCNAPVQK